MTAEANDETDFSKIFLKYKPSTILFYYFNRSKVTNMYNMLKGCDSLTSLDLSSFNFSNVENTDFMLIKCSSLKN